MDKKPTVEGKICEPSICEGQETAQEPKLEKKFNFWTALGIAICSSGAWEGWAASLAQGITGGGPVGLVWGWVVVSVGITCLGASLAEFSSRWPSAGGQYTWAANLAPKKYARIVSWFTAWFSIAGLWLGSVSSGMGVAVQIQGYVMATSNYTAKTWHAFLICLAMMVCVLTVNILFVRALHWINWFVLVIHVVGYLIVIGTLTGRAKDKRSAEYVFTHFESNTGWDNDFVSWSVSLLTALYAFFSLDGAVHFSEEIPRANVLIPRALMIQVVSSALMTFPFIIAVLFCIGDTAAVLSSPLGLTTPFTQIGINATRSVGVGIFLNCLSTSVAFAAAVDLWAAASRALWSMARDGGLHHVVGRLHAKTNAPVIANLILVLPSVVIYMIYIWNTTAFYGIMAGVFANYAKPAFSLGPFGLLCNVLGFLFACYMIIFMSFPVYEPVTGANMNYASVIVGAIAIFTAVAWLAYGSKSYQGGLAELTPARIPDTEDGGNH